MPVIVVGNEKGGCGKTTISVNIAAAAAGHGLRVLLIDADPGQQSCARWAAVRRQRHPELPRVLCVSLHTGSMTEELQDFEQQFGLVVVDTGAEDSPQLRAAATVAAVLIVPCQPDELDLWTLPTMGAVLRGARRFNDGLRAVVALNRIPHQSADRLPGDINAWIASHVPVLGEVPVVSLIGRSAYGRASGEGLGVSEAPNRDPKAAAEMARLYSEISV